MSVEVFDLNKAFGRVRAVKGVSFAVAPGEIFGLLGPNGAGKTTTLRILATLVRADSGRAIVAGHDVTAAPEEVRRSIGVVNGGMGLYDRLTGREILSYFGRLYGMSTAQVDRRIRELDGQLELRETLDRQAGGFSTGMKQKVVVARAVLHDPRVIFFDEATSGLDVMARRAVLALVRRFARDGKAVVYSTHVMSEVEELCDRVAIILGGEIVAHGSVRGLLDETDAADLEQAFFAIVDGSGRAGEASA